jgi:hypothetical protein
MQEPRRQDPFPNVRLLDGITGSTDQERASAPACAPTHGGSPAHATTRFDPRRKLHVDRPCGKRRALGRVTSLGGSAPR